MQSQPMNINFFIGIEEIIPRHEAHYNLPNTAQWLI